MSVFIDGISDNAAEGVLENVYVDGSNGFPFSSAGNVYVNGVLANPVVTELVASATYKGGILKCIDSATGDVARTTNGWIEDEKYNISLLVKNTAVSAEFDSAVTRTGRLTLKLSATDITGRPFAGMGTQGETPTETLPNLLKYYIPVKPSTVYRLQCYAKTNNAVANQTYITVHEWDNAGTRVAADVLVTNRIGGTVDWTLLTKTIAVSATTSYIALYFRHNVVAGNISDAWFDINSMTLEEVVSATATRVKAIKPIFTAITILDSIGQSQILSGSTAQLGDGTRQKRGQQFTPTKKYFTGLTFKRAASSGTFAGDVEISIQTDSSNTPSAVKLATITIPNATWNAITVNTDYTVSLPCILNADGSTKYWIVWASSTSDASNFASLYLNGTDVYSGGIAKTNNGTSWGSADSVDWYFKCLYAKKTERFMVNANNTILGLNSDADGLKHGAVWDLDKKTYTYNVAEWMNSATSLPNYSDFNSATLAGNGFSVLRLTNGLPVVATNSDNLVLKFNTIIPITDPVLTMNSDIAAACSFKVQYSLDNSAYTDLITFTNADTGAVRSITIPITSQTVFYLRLVAVASTCYVRALRIFGYLNDSTLAYPTTTVGSNTIYLGSGSVNADSANDPSLQMTAQLKY